MNCGQYTGSIQLSLLPSPDAVEVADTPHLADYDLVLLNTSAGKDSQAMMDVVVAQGRAEGAADRLVAVHCDLGDVEWPGTRQLAAKQSARYGLRFEVVRNEHHADLLARVEHRRDRLDAAGKPDTPAWPSSTNRWCTSEFKTAQVRRLATRLVAEIDPQRLGRPVRILNCLGLRAAESPARAKKLPFRRHEAGKGWTNSRRVVDEWLPIFTWSADQVWEQIRRSGVPHHPAYDAGMPRLSCCFCVLGSKSALIRAAQLRPDLADRYVAVEARVRSRFRQDLSMAEIVEAAGQVKTNVAIADWVA